MNLRKLYKLYLRLDYLSRKSKDIEQEINKELEEQKIERILDSGWYVDGCHAYASNGEFSFSYKDFKDAINKTLKGKEFYPKGSEKRGRRNNEKETK